MADYQYLQVDGLSVRSYSDNIAEAYYFGYRTLSSQNGFFYKVGEDLADF